MKTVLITIQIAVSLLLILSILLQNKGVGLSETFGGEGNVYSTKRGAEKFLYYASIALSVLLVLNTLAFALLS